MSFASPVFLWYFMPLTLACYWLLPAAARNGVLAVASLVFYAWGAGAFTLLLLACIAVNFAAGLAVDTEWPVASPRGRRLVLSPRGRQLVLSAAVAFAVAILCIWKYGPFASRQLDALDRQLGGSGSGVLKVALPIGISFFTFHHLSYVIDVYRGSRRAQRSPLQFVTYIAMFPQVIVGPIVRYHEIADQLSDRRQDRLGDFTAGFPRFVLGLAKKVVVADTIAPVANAAFAADSAHLPTAAAWIGALAYAGQIYFDFSGYSDMAIGLGQMFGFRLPENFARPYSAVSIADFWRRWHMSLSRWFRDYLYVPLRGNRGSTVATYRNLYVVFALTGFWHGANWTFLAWGIFHGTLLVVERVRGWASVDFGGRTAVRRMLTFLLVVVGWVLFRAESVGHAASMLTAMFVPRLGPLPQSVATALTERRTVVLALALLVVALPRNFVLGRVLDHGRGVCAALVRVAVVSTAAPVAAVLVAAGTFSPFLYYRF